MFSTITGWIRFSSSQVSTFFGDHLRTAGSLAGLAFASTGLTGTEASSFSATVNLATSVSDMLENKKVK